MRLLSYVALTMFSAHFSCALAQERDTWRFRQFQIENDDRLPIPYSEPHDRFYTSGVRVSFGKPGVDSDDDLEALPRWARAISRRCSACTVYPTFSIGQNLYTPERIEIAEPQAGERPWAAWLYGAIGAAVYSRGGRARHDFELQAGATGKAAGGEWVQKGWHELINSAEPHGWDNQFDSGLGFNAFYTYQRIMRGSNAPRVVDWDLVPSFNAAIGTINSYVGVGGTLRIGRNISDFPYTPIRPSEMRSIPDRLQNFEIYGFVGADARAVAHNYFLQGSLFKNEAGTVEARDFVWDFKFGITVRFNRTNITYAVVRRSEEFYRTVGSDRGIHSFGSLSITRGIRQ